MTEIKDLKGLLATAKNAYQIHGLVQSNLHHTVDLKDYKWVSEGAVKAYLAQYVLVPKDKLAKIAEKIMADKKKLGGDFAFYVDIREIVDEQTLKEALE